MHKHLIKTPYDRLADQYNNEISFNEVHCFAPQSESHNI
jgi:hypothetical protein